MRVFVQVYDEHFSLQYGFWRPYVEQVIYRYLDCGDLHNGFARVKRKDWTMNISWPSLTAKTPKKSRGRNYSERALLNLDKWLAEGCKD